MKAATEELTRQYQGRTIPAPGAYTIDTKHSTVEFVARHLMVAKVRGRFGQFEGIVTIGENPLDSKAEVTIDAASVDTSEPQRDTHIRSADFLDVENFPQIVFKSTGVQLQHGVLKLAGELTVRDVTRPVVLDVEFEGASPTPWGTTAIGFSASTEFDRDDFGVSFNAALETGGLVVGKRVRIELNVEASRPG